MESPDRPCSISVDPGGDRVGALTEESCTFQKKKKKDKITQVYLQEYINIFLQIPFTVILAVKSSPGTSAFRLSFLIWIHAKDHAP